MWHALLPEERERGALNEDFCRIRAAGEESLFVRGVLEIPIIDARDQFGYGVWALLERESFERVLAFWDDPAHGGETHSGRLANSLPGYPATLDLRAIVRTRPGGIRPAIELEPSGHPLATQQRRGITMAAVREIAEFNLHEAGPGDRDGA